MNACHHISGFYCPNCKPIFTSQPITITPIPQKCDICGSTAIDHTEAQCSLNRTFQSFKPAPNPTKAEGENG